MEDYTIFEKPTIVASSSGPTNNVSSTNSKPKVKTVPLYRAKRPSRMSTGSCHIAIEEISAGKDYGKFNSTFFFKFMEIGPGLSFFNTPYRATAMCFKRRVQCPFFFPPHQMDVSFLNKYALLPVF